MVYVRILTENLTQIFVRFVRVPLILMIFIRKGHYQKDESITSNLSKIIINSAGIYVPAYFISILRDFHGDINARPGRAEYANLLAGIDLWHSVLMAVNTSTAKAFDTWNMRNTTNSVMSVAQHHGVENLCGFCFGLQ